MKLALYNSKLSLSQLALADAEEMLSNILPTGGTPHRSPLRIVQAGLFVCDVALADPVQVGILKKALQAALAADQTDFALLTDGFSPKQFGLLATDMDSTLITIECIDEIADFVGKKAEVSAITEAAMRGEIKSFADSLTRRVALLQGVDASHLADVFNERLRLSPGAKPLLAFIKQQGWKTLLVSGGFTYFTDRLKNELGLDYARSNTLEIIDGKLTGRVLGEIVDAQAKADTLTTVCTELGLNTQQSIAMGDGANDLIMMKAAGLGVAYRAKPIVQEQTSVAINHHGLDTLVAWFKAAAA